MHVFYVDRLSASFLFQPVRCSREKKGSEIKWQIKLLVACHFCFCQYKVLLSKLLFICNLFTFCNLRENLVFICVYIYIFSLLVLLFFIFKLKYQYCVWKIDLLDTEIQTLSTEMVLINSILVLLVFPRGVLLLWIEALFSNRSITTSAALPQEIRRYSVQTMFRSCLFLMYVDRVLH